MKKILSGFVMIFPYLFIFLTYVIITSKQNFMTFIIMATIMIMIFLISFIATIIHMIFTWDSKNVLFFNLLIKLVYLPLHLILFIIMGGMANPFLLILIPVPLIISSIFMGITGTIFVVAIIKDYRNYKLSKIVIYCLLSYCYITDIIIAIMAYIKATKYEKLKNDY